MALMGREFERRKIRKRADIDESINCVGVLKGMDACCDLPL